MSSSIPKLPPIDSPRDALVVVSRRGRRRHATTPPLVEGTPDFVALGTWTHQRSREFDIVPINEHYNWKSKVVLPYGTIRWR